MNDAPFIIDETFELEAEPKVSKIETTDDAASTNDDALLTALAVEQIATQKRKQTTTAQDVKRDVVKRRETSKPNDENDATPRQPSRWKTAALAWFGSFAIFCAVATLTFALTRDASPTQTAATPTVAATVPASDVSQIASPTPTQNAEPQAIAFEEPALDATFAEESQVDKTTQNAELQAIAFEEPTLDDKTSQTPLDATLAEEPQAVEKTQTLADAEFAPSEPAIYRKKISEVKIGERAVGVNPQGATPGEDDAIFGREKHCGYKLCYLKENGTTCEIELLRPVDWLDYERVQLRRKNDGKVLDELDFAIVDILSTNVAPPVATTNDVAPSTADKLGVAATNDGESPNLAGLNDVASPIIVDFTPAYDVEIWLELPEMGVLGWATLEEIDDEIAIQPGPGNVVTGTFAHVSDAVIDLQIEGQPKPIGCTTTHPFWSVDRQDFVEAGQLQQGERVQLYNGETKRVVQKLPRPGPVNVYNLEVYAEHVYSVTPDGVLTHNSCNPLRTNMIKNGIIFPDKTYAHHIVAQKSRYAQRARRLLKKVGIDVHNPINGVALDREKHKRLHTQAYYIKVHKRLQKAFVTSQRDERKLAIENELRKIADEINAGTFLPKDVNHLNQNKH